MQHEEEAVVQRGTEVHVGIEVSTVWAKEDFYHRFRRTLPTISQAMTLHHPELDSTSLPTRGLTWASKNLPGNSLVYAVHAPSQSVKICIICPPVKRAIPEPKDEVDGIEMVDSDAVDGIKVVFFSASVGRWLNVQWRDMIIG